METIIKWSILNMKHNIAEGGVIEVYWELVARNEVDLKAATYRGKSEFAPEPDAPNFVPYTELTEEMVLSWVFAALGDKKVAIEADRIAKVEKQLRSTIENGLPWNASEIK